MTSKRTVEQELFEAWQENRGCRLSRKQVDALMTLDDAIRTRITNQAMIEAGLDKAGVGGDEVFPGETWSQLKKRLREQCS